MLFSSLECKIKVKLWGPGLWSDQILPNLQPRRLPLEYTNPVKHGTSPWGQDAQGGLWSNPAVKPWEQGQLLAQDYGWCLQAHWAQLEARVKPSNSWLEVRPKQQEAPPPPGRREARLCAEKRQTCTRFNCCYLLKGFKLLSLACDGKQPGPGAPHPTAGTCKGDLLCHLPSERGKPQQILPWSVLAPLKREQNI